MQALSFPIFQAQGRYPDSDSSTKDGRFVYLTIMGRREHDDLADVQALVGGLIDIIVGALFVFRRL
ncbi:hypothetical protein M6D93_13765 [Jatrophihabitans telluris]|uniref:Uncharacterized protein n=1 Tax=Jatrophihabitans telluris TaxID=2038343 RepID=A0ABY4QX07_9ACTN|nr:hypothetical protein [Jatrophihabitans telluris]UQX87361.1 hypothetical protein M6D93_13765 [Jatrophihabitans telluris]